MGPFLFISPCAISSTQLAEFVVELGGQWQTYPAAQGVIDGAEGTVYVSRALAPETEYDDQELDLMANQMGGRPNTLVVLEFGHAEGSKQLALQVGESLQNRFGGIVDGNGIVDV